MSEDSSHPIGMHAVNSPAAVDLRRVGAHPDYWYPLAWSEELKVGQTLGRRFAGLPIVIYRGKAEKCSRWRIAVPTARYPCISGW